ncbi:MAG: hypothetical protein EZS28_000870 [Streblomastix strix]|uniref:Signal recognition particle 14 kDa protein n=1 Tax=Streblomastix strix TaxID=222440 RepID=A0A5J4X8T5_9EUKA|nr:MAG: hypothetical protein EZS28_000870 [Streblomastix strix]
MAELARLKTDVERLFESVKKKGTVYVTSKRLSGPKLQKALKRKQNTEKVDDKEMRVLVHAKTSKKKVSALLSLNDYTNFMSYYLRAILPTKSDLKEKEKKSKHKKKKITGK